MSGLGLTFLRRGGQAHPTAGSDYIKFKDEAVFNVLMSKGVSSDGVGITRDDAAKVTTIGTWFKGNANITSFDELKYFTSVKTIDYQAFHSCSALVNVNLENVEAIGDEVFVFCANLRMDVNAPNLKNLGKYAFFQSGITGIQSLGEITTIPDGQWIPSNRWTQAVFSLCNNLTRVVLNEGLQTIGYGTFANDGAITIVDLPSTLTRMNAACLAECVSLGTIISRAMTPPTIANANVFQSVPVQSIYVPDASVEAYKSAAGWSSYAAKIKGISEYQG